ncbi:MAG: FAD-binding oxidoreductase [Betaproteobacteria bacterium]|nr:MAG: FAD-binding oxidoreductase [Betaproteobacteria bacterium]
MSSLIAQLSEAVGPRNVLTVAADVAPFCTDWRKRFTGRADAVVFPATTREAAAVVLACTRHAAAIVTQGGNTGLSGGATPAPDGHSVVLNTRRMNRIRDIDPDNDTITVEAGCTLQAVRDAAQHAGRLFPLSLAAQGSCTIGGNLATNAGGTQVLRYGNTRDLALGLEVVLPSGDVWDGLRALRKDNSGYDVKQVFIGSEGTLGVITAATLKLFALPRSRLTALAGLESVEAAIELLKRMRSAAGPTLTAFELMSRDSLNPVAPMLGLKQFPFEPLTPWTVLLEISDHEDESHARSLLEAGLDPASGAPVIDAVLSRSLAESERLWRLREAIPESQAQSGGNVKHDISLPLSRVSDFVQETGERLAREFDWAHPVVFGHLGDGNLHYNVGCRAGVSPQVAFEHEQALNEIVYEAVYECGGSISAEHGLGQLKRGAARRYKSAVELALMHAIKSALDPDGRMNPGKLL